MAKVNKPAAKVSLVDLSAFDDAFEGIINDMDSAPTLSIEACQQALIDEVLHRLSGFKPREDNVQDEVNQVLSNKLRNAESPLQAWVNNVMDAIRSLKQASDKPSNAADCGVTDAPVGTPADLVRDRIEALLIFGRAINRQVARASFYRIRKIDALMDAAAQKAQSAKKDAAGHFTGTFAVLEDREYPGWNRVRVDSETVYAAADEIGKVIRNVYERVVASGTTSQWFAANQPFDFGSESDGSGNYTHFVSLKDSHESLAKSVATKVRDRASAHDIASMFKV